MSGTKRQVLPAGLWVVATPIGNLEDITPRAAAALAEAGAILCEDTRQTSKLLAALGISKPLVRLDAHASPEKLRQIVDRLVNGESLALVTDAGTPGISDPGAALVGLAWRYGIRVTPLPGPSAVPTLLSAAGFEDTAFVFRGFFPRKAGERKQELALCLNNELAQVFVWFESPQRVVEALETIAAEASGAQVVCAKELTKIFEKIFVGAADEVADAVRAEQDKEGARGEWLFAVKFPFSDKKLTSMENEGKSSEWVKALQCLIDARVAASEAARQVSQHFGVSKKIAYAEALRLSGKKSD